MPMLRRTSRKPAGEKLYQILPVHQHFAVRRSFQQVHTSHQRGLSCAGQPDDAEYLAVLHRQVDVIQCCQRPVLRVEGFIQIPQFNHGLFLSA